MTPTEFLNRRAYGLIQPDEPVRTILFSFPGGNEWQEIFVGYAGRYGEYGTIANQEQEFRAKLSPLCTFISEYRPQDTVPAKNWRM